MSSFALVDATTYIHDLDFTTYLNEISLSGMAEELDSTTFGSGGYRTRVGGLRDIEAAYNGFFEGIPDNAAFTALGTADRVVTMSPTGVETSTAYLFQADEFTYTPFGSIGDLTPFSIDIKGSNTQGLVRGQLAAAKQNKSATGQLGSIVNLGAPSGSQFVYCTVHIFTAGTTITLQLQSDDAVGFSSPTTRATIGPLTTTGGTWMTRLAGPFSGETHWRLNVSAVTGTFSIAAAIAVQ